MKKDPGELDLTRRSETNWQPSIQKTNQAHMNGRPCVVAVGVIDSTLLVVMLLWKPSRETLPVLFVVVGFWGMAEAIMFTQLISE